ncbi:germination-specific N-acetylmuramoyl-L-alanine amidase [Clostridiales bacterium]|nr:germination-specific N-acetylmuramoyl-L-alanine amidase [Clostridiales bacterium]
MKFRAIYIKNVKNTLTVALLCAIITAAGILGDKSSIEAMLPVENKVVIIDAGHGGFDPGKTGTNGKNEKDINLNIAIYLQQYLEQGGATAIVTRGTDEALGETKKSDMAERKNITNNSGGDILISIHQNSFTSGKASGAQVFYYKTSDEGKRLAETIQKSMAETIDSSNTRLAKSNSDYYVLRATQIPAALVECGFLSNAAEEAKLNTAEYQQDIAWAIYKGILEYFNE